MQLPILVETLQHAYSGSLTVTEVFYDIHHKTPDPTGREVAEYAARHLPKDLLESSEYVKGDYETALKKVFLGIDAELATESGRSEIAHLAEEPVQVCGMSPSKNGSMSGITEDGPEMKGCTANVVLIKSGRLYVANAGDSRAVLAKKGTAVELSTDHKPELEGEAVRIGKAGGCIVEGRVNGNLNLSRALGDLRYKADPKLKPEEQIISGEPDIKQNKLEADMDFVVIGCDGVYETKTSQEIVDFIYAGLAKNGNKVGPAVEALLEDVCSPDCIQTEGVGCDNMTCIVIRFIH